MNRLEQLERERDEFLRLRVVGIAEDGGVVASKLVDFFPGEEPGIFRPGKLAYLQVDRPCRVAHVVVRLGGKMDGPPAYLNPEDRIELRKLTITFKEWQT